MSLLVLGDSNVELAWLHARNNREMLRTAIFVPVKQIDQLQPSYQSITPSVSITIIFRCYVSSFVSHVLYNI